jgi:PAS domain S-box-containing protein
VRGTVGDARERELLELLDKLGIAAWLTNRVGQVDECNKAACELVEREKEEVLGVVLADELVVEANKEEAKAAVTEAIAGGEKLGMGMGVVTDKQGLVDECNRTACRLLEKEKEEVVGLKMAEEVVVEDGKKVTEEAVLKAVEGGEVDGMFVSVMPKGGMGVSVSADVGPRRSVSGAITGTMVLAQRTNPDEVAIKLDSEGKVVECNAKAVEVLGLGSAEELIGKDFVQDVMAVEGREAGAEIVGKALGGEAQYGESMLLDGPGTQPLHLEGDAMPRKEDGEGQGQGATVRGTVGDARERELLELLDKLGIAAWLTNRVGQVDECNKAACELVEREKEEVLGVVLADELVVEANKEEAKAAVTEAIAGGEKLGMGMGVVTDKQGLVDECNRTACRLLEKEKEEEAGMHSKRVPTHRRVMGKRICFARKDHLIVFHGFSRSELDLATRGLKNSGPGTKSSSDRLKP